MPLNGSIKYAVVVLCGVALAFAFPEPAIGPLAWVALAPLLALTAGAGARRGAGLGFAFGLAFFGSLLYWISIIGYLGWAVLVLLQALFLALLGLVWTRTNRLSAWPARIAAAATAWVAIEFLRSIVPVGGFTWGQLSQSQTEFSWLLPAAALGGGWLVAGIVVAVNAALAEVVVAFRSGARRRGLAAAAAMVGLLLAPLGIPRNDATGEEVRVAIVQGNVPRNFEGSTYEKELAILASHQHLTEELAGVSPDLVVWPESSVGLDLTTNDDSAGAVRAAAQSVDAPMIVGGNLDVGEDRYKVMAFQIDPDGEVVDQYQKTHLVPFGEYVPARGVLGWIPALDQVPRDAVASDQPVVFDVAGGRVAPVISFEGDFGSLVRKPIAEGGRLLVVATNTSTWGDSWASAQHVAFSRVRAVENGVWVAHAALSGISAFISPRGDIVDSTPLWVPAALVHELRFAADITLYARFGDWFPLLSIAATVLALVAAGRLRTKQGLRGGEREAPGVAR
ncbi:MAG: apolipoprotein N-acyltransferase [Actinomycetota bacterium]